MKGVDLQVVQDGLQGLKYNHNLQSTIYGDTNLTVFIESNYFDTPKKQELYPQSGKIILRRSLTPEIYLDKPIRIKLPSN